jgi:hypothetical protein
VRLPDLDWPADLFTDAADARACDDSDRWIVRLRCRIDLLAFSARAFVTPTASAFNRRDCMVSRRAMACQLIDWHATRGARRRCGPAPLNDVYD